MEMLGDWLGFVIKKPESSPVDKTVAELARAAQDYLVQQYCIYRYGNQWRWYYIHYRWTRELML